MTKPSGLSNGSGPLIPEKNQFVCAGSHANRYRKYVLAVLTGSYAVNYLDRGLIMLLLQPIKVDLKLSDTQLGLLTGIAFGIFYATVGLPIARLADKGNRVTLASVALALWGLTVMMSVLVTNFVQLVAARIAAAVGEAGCMPPTYSLVGDYYPGASERPRAMAIYMLASPLSSLLSFVGGAWLSTKIGWRGSLFIAGIPGLLFAFLVKTTIKEPRQKRALQVKNPPPFSLLLQVLWSKRALRHLIVAYVLLSTLAYGLAPWYAAFLIRSHSMSTMELGPWLGLIFGFGGIVGILAGGNIVARLLTNNICLQMRLASLCIAFLFPCLLLFLLLHNKYGALSALLFFSVAMGMILGPAFSLMQRLVPDEMRATTLAVVMLLSNIIGMGLGPFLVGAISDLVAPIFGSDALRYAMLVVSLITIWSSLHFWLVGKSADAELVGVGESYGQQAGARSREEPFHGL